MKALFKTLFGDWRTITVVTLSLVVTQTVAYLAWPQGEGLVLPLSLISGIYWLALA